MRVCVFEIFSVRACVSDTIQRTSDLLVWDSVKPSQFGGWICFVYLKNSGSSVKARLFLCSN